METALYRLYDRHDVLLYVGISDRPESRWVKHAIDKAWWREIRSLALEWFATRVDAETAETAAIRDERPLHNGVAGKQSRRPGPTPRQAIRIDAGLWAEYEKACADEGVTRSDDVRAHIEKKIRAWKRRQAKTPPSGE